jgi:hypothetical protein
MYGEYRTELASGHALQQALWWLVLARGLSELTVLTGFQKSMEPAKCKEVNE